MNHFIPCHDALGVLAAEDGLVMLSGTLQSVWRDVDNSRRTGQYVGLVPGEVGWAVDGERVYAAVPSMAAWLRLEGWDMWK